jgi:hypothetical protein
MLAANRLDAELGRSRREVTVYHPKDSLAWLLPFLQVSQTVRYKELSANERQSNHWMEYSHAYLRIVF